MTFFSFFIHARYHLWEKVFLSGVQKSEPGRFTSETAAPVPLPGETGLLVSLSEEAFSSELMTSSQPPLPQHDSQASMGSFFSLYSTIALSYSTINLWNQQYAMTQKNTPMHVPANMPRLVTCQERARKHESIVYQFHNMEILHIWAVLLLELPIDIILFCTSCGRNTSGTASDIFLIIFVDCDFLKFHYRRKNDPAKHDDRTL